MVCLDQKLDNFHGFIGSDTTGKQYTAFFDPETLKPQIIKYQEQTMLIRNEDWVSREVIDKKKEFQPLKCPSKPAFVMNNDAPLTPMNYFGILN